MKYTVLTLFPDILDAWFSASIMARAVKAGLVSYHLVNIRDFALDRHRSCDDAPYGGGAGMLMLPEPLGRALEAAGAKKRKPPKDGSPKDGSPKDGVPKDGVPKDGPRVVYLTPSGRLFNQDLAAELALEEEIILVCGRYEGIDQRIIDRYVDDEISVGDYVLSSGEAAALAVIDATYRLLAAVISPASLEEESFDGYLLEYPQYTRPEVYDTLEVPGVLLSGHHEHIRRWRRRKQVEKTLAVRPDLIRLGEEHNRYDTETARIIAELRGKNERDTGD
ncbi:MAG: tRNA (guanosine(37)-N1)-methyltransferase TrmD [Spirochaetaceae bacterium]|jgi:tRNA (guanine37-N1)-methyltransferase|nr:tRNA (guanosine(37)-N1)-methyltransferase TrmD [Spirochaetaceae bacterium]